MPDKKSAEERVEDCIKQQLNAYKLRYFAKNESINSEIDEAMQKAPSKSGGSGGNYPDIRLLMESKSKKVFPVMIECKGVKGRLEKLTDGQIDDMPAKGDPKYSAINGYAVNGAVHYSKAVLQYTKTYREVIAVGINGYIEAGELQIELGVYYVSSDNLSLPKKVGKYSDLSFLAPEHFEGFVKKVEQLKLTPQELEAQSRKTEERIEHSLITLNQAMQDDLNIAVGLRVPLVAGMIMAGLGVEGKVAPLEAYDLKGQETEEEHDGAIIIRKISSFLTGKDLPQEKKAMIVNNLSDVFIHAELWRPKNKESKLKTVYKDVKDEILSLFKSKHHLDFAGKLFNVLNSWVAIPDSERNDVVLTPRYVTEMMAKLAKVDRNSFVWDYAVGSAGFLISAMKIMLEDAERIKSPKERQEKILNIKTRQLLGIEKRHDIYLLAVLNMILMKDGSSNILHMDSLTEYGGNYEQGGQEIKDKPFPANVFLLNPPYSASGKGLVFVKKALARMTTGRAVVLIQENAGSGNGLPYTRELLENNTLLASIHMADIFRGKAGVQTAVYVFEVGKPHEEKYPVKFIDMSNDGYTRLDRRKSGPDVNLRDTNNAAGRYQEVVDLVKFNKSYLHYFTEEEYIEDCITLNGDDWTFTQHKKIDTVPTEEDFVKVISDYLAWEVGQVLRGEHDA
ncbi:MAG: SAM-dependent methyltransferase [Oscillospiraceae bacterium]|nr:SAM-dependent methyltransferase [Oscillospiraceae bacterium]